MAHRLAALAHIARDFIPGSENRALSAAPAPVARLAGVGVRFGEVEALRGVDLDVRAGEVLGLLGPN
ncbi:MAG TPA: sugar ABC transporter ATP-binding protein, partial [Planctomycetota bacterium]|nr:sugar ABC transporter ATP-binding protein [Planctomycetota bacterium]